MNSIKNLLTPFYTEGSNNGFLNSIGVLIAIKCGYTIHYTCYCSGTIATEDVNGYIRRSRNCDCCGSSGHLAIIADVPRISNPTTDYYFRTLKDSLG